MPSFTPAQILAAYDALGLDHDLTLSVSISPGYVHVSTAETDPGGHPVVTGGMLQSVSTAYTVEEAQNGDS